MQNSFVQISGDSVTFDKNQLITYAVIAAVVIVVLIVLVIAAKRRKKDFIKTIPTNLKEDGK